MKVEVEAESPDRTHMYFRADSGAASDYWHVGITTDDRARTWYTVDHDGAVVYELSAREVRTNERGTIATECFVTSRMREPIPAEIMSHLPAPHRVRA